MKQVVYQTKQIASQFNGIYNRLNKIAGGIPGVFVRSVQSFNDAQAMESAASIAYYALFSVFPLLLFITAFLSSFLADEGVQQFIVQFVEDSVPAYFQELILGNIERALDARGTVQLVSMIGLLWVASSVFTAISRNLDLAWQVTNHRNFIFGRLVGFGMIGAITIGLLILWLMSTTLVNLLPLLEIPVQYGNNIRLHDTLLWGLFSRTIPWFLIFLALFGLYRWVPSTTVKWYEAFWGAVIAAFGWDLAQRGFSWYLTSGLARYQLVYGSLGAVIAFMLWLYITAVIVLYGAHLAAAIAFQHRLKPAGSDEREKEPAL
jgi:membrane protein